MTFGMQQSMGNKVPSGYKVGRLQQFSPEQMQLFQSLFSNVAPGSYLSRLAGGDESLFNQMEAPAMRQFQGLQGQLASRFSGMGLGGRHSSGFQNTATAASSNFAQELQAQRQALQRQAIEDLMGFSHTLLGERPFQQDLFEKHKKKPAVGGFGGAIGAGLGGLGGFLVGGPAGAMAGGSLGYGIGSAF